MVNGDISVFPNIYSLGKDGVQRSVTVTLENCAVERRGLLIKLFTATDSGNWYTLI